MIAIKNIRKRLIVLGKISELKGIHFWKKKKQQKSIEGDFSVFFPFSKGRLKTPTHHVHQGEHRKAGTELENTQNILYSHINIKLNKNNL